MDPEQKCVAVGIVTKRVSLGGVMFFFGRSKVDDDG